MMTTIDLVKSAMQDIERLTLQGHVNWSYANNALNKLSSVVIGLQKEQEAKEKADEEAITEAKAFREKQKAEAAERGEQIIGGETIRINADGTQEVIIP